MILFFLSIALAKSEITADIVKSKEKVVISQQASVANSPSGTLTLFFDGTDLKIKNSAGAVTVIGSAQAIPSGAVMSFASSTCPSGWLLADGTTISRTTYAALFAAIGTAHGTGDGASTFHLPDYRGRFLRGVAAGVGRDEDRASRTAMNVGGNTGDNVGSIQLDAYLSHQHFSFAEVNATSNITEDTINNTTYVTSQNVVSGGSSINYSMIGTATVANEGLTSLSGGSETRPENAYVIYCVKE